MLQSQSTDHRINVVACLFDESVHCHDGQLGPLLGVEDNEVVDHFLLEDVRGVCRLQTMRWVSTYRHY